MSPRMTDVQAKILCWLNRYGSLDFDSGDAKGFSLATANVNRGIALVRRAWRLLE